MFRELSPFSGIKETSVNQKRAKEKAKEKAESIFEDIILTHMPWSVPSGDKDELPGMLSAIKISQESEDVKCKIYQLFLEFLEELGKLEEDDDFYDCDLRVLGEIRVQVQTEIGRCVDTSGIVGF